MAFGCIRIKRQIEFDVVEIIYNHSHMKIIDITHPISESMPIYPKNPKVSFKTFEGKTSTHTEISLGTHTGTHIDAPRHVFKNGKTVDKIDIYVLYGPCRVLDMTKAKIKITVDDLKPHRIKKGERILVKTRNSQRGWKKFYSDFVYLDGDAADYLAQKSIALFGIDYLSVKKKGGNDNRPHTSLLRKGVVIFEGLNLKNVSEGKYQFVGLPLLLKRLDGSPARAILIQ